MYRGMNAAFGVVLAAAIAGSGVSLAQNARPKE
jgi:hypothetical protein